MIDHDVLVASLDLAGRSGARNIEFGYLDDNVPVEQARWWAKATYEGAVIVVEGKRSPTEAADALARRLLRDAKCTNCGRRVVTSHGDGCYWTRIGDRWTRGCAPKETN